MSINLPKLSGLFVILATLTLPVVAVAQTPADYENYESIPKSIDEAFFNSNPNFYGNRSLQRQVDFLVGPGGKFGTTFPENEIARDGESVNIVYKDLLEQQSQNDPYLRTPDLPNPYNSSLLMSPQYNANQLKVGTEYRFDTLTSR